MNLMRSKTGSRRRCGCLVREVCDCPDEKPTKLVAPKLYVVVGPRGFVELCQTAQLAADRACDLARQNVGRTYYTLHPSQEFVVDEQPVKVTAYTPPPKSEE